VAHSRAARGLGTRCSSEGVAATLRSQSQSIALDGADAAELVDCPVTSDHPKSESLPSEVGPFRNFGPEFLVNFDGEWWIRRMGLDDPNKHVLPADKLHLLHFLTWIEHVIACSRSTRA